MTSKNKQIGSTSSHSSSPSLRWIYDIFVSFRGEDTRKNFTDHLYAALVQKGIIVFRDDCRLEKGKAIAPELLKAIEESRFSIVIFSSNYASSTWCLDELVKIVECMEASGQTVFPIFYKVEPSEVRKQTGNFRTAFAKHEEVFRENIQKVRRWRAALTEVANLSGWDLQDRHESTFIQEIVEEIWNKLNNRVTCTDKYLVGIDSRMEELFQYLGIGMDDIRFIGICGMGGIGKTTLSQVVYDKISCEFEGSSFVANVRETSERCGLASLQEQLLSEVLRDRNIRIQNAHAGVNAIMTRCCHRKILLILDDVDQQEQLEKLAGNHDWFGSGSRIIITTRDEHLLVSHGVDGIYQARGLNNDEALQLFSWKAFKKDHPTRDYQKLLSLVINYADGLPLALEILGSFLFDRKVHEWESALDRLKKVPNRKIMEVLKISYDGLEETEKEIFLDIACFFQLEFKGRLTRILNGCGFYADIGLSVLIEKSLINVSCNIVHMHDLIQEMGRDIVRRESPKEPGKRSRLWHSEDIYDVLLNKKGTEAVEGLVLVSGQKVVALDADAFSKLSKLRLLKISNVRLPRGLKYLSNELRYLKWHGYPLKSLPSGFRSEKLFKLNMCYSHVEQLWEGTEHFDKLKVIKLSHSRNLVKTPDFTATPHLEKLILDGCTSLSDIHPSLSVLKSLIILNLKDCKRLEKLPNNIELESLRICILSGCTKLKKFPEIKGNMDNLIKLSLDGTAIRELPSTIEYMRGLVFLILRGCKNLVRLPAFICNLKSLRVLSLNGCSKLDRLPENLGDLRCMEELHVGGTALRQLPSSIGLLERLKVLSFRQCNDLPSADWRGYQFRPPLLAGNNPNMVLSLSSLTNLCSLTELDLSGCNLMEGALPFDLCRLRSLEKLNLSMNDFVSIPESINQLTLLKELHLSNCKMLQSLPKLPSSIGDVVVDDCPSLDKFPHSVFACTVDFAGCSFANCYKLVEGEGDNSMTFTLLKRYLQSSLKFWRQEPVHEHTGINLKGYCFNSILPGSKIPSWFMHQSVGSTLNINTQLHWCDSKFMGVAVCAVFAIRKNPILVRRYKDSGLYSLISCKLDTEKGVMSPGFSFPLCRVTSIKNDHIWLTYLSRRFLPTFADEWWMCSRIEASFDSDVQGLEVKRCGLRLVYDEDIEDILCFDESTLEGSIISQSHCHGEAAPRGRSDDIEDSRIEKLRTINPLFVCACSCLLLFVVGMFFLIHWGLSPERSENSVIDRAEWQQRINAAHPT